VLYRLSYVGPEPTAAVAPDEQPTTGQALRRSLERFHGRRDPEAVATVWPYLGDPDRAIRFAARTALEWQDAAEWRDRALGERSPRSAIAALVALARVSGKDSIHRADTVALADPVLQTRLIGALNRLAWPALGIGDRLDLLRAYALVFTRLGPPPEPMRRQLITRFEPRLPASDRDLNVQLTNLLVYLESPRVASRGMALLTRATTQEEQIEYVLALRGLKAGWTPSLRDQYFRWFVTTAAPYRGGNTFARALSTIRTEAIRSLDEAERPALEPVLALRPESRSPQQRLAARTTVRAWTVDELAPRVEQGLRGGRSFERGRRLYSEIACSACHRFAGDGGSIGPDLSAVAGRFGVRDLLEATIEPSRTISDQYAAIVIRKQNGEVITGRVANLSGPNVEVVENMLEPGRFTRVRREEIASITPAATSMMPPGLLNSLTVEEVQDLMAYLISRGNARHQVFR
jgi:putative heme-binding domain-containing protein